ncbi:MAG: DUF255 domain-containing protein [Bacteroidota bacterium]
MKRLITTLLVYSIFFSTLIAQTAENTKVKWMSWEEAVEKLKVEKRKIIIAVYKDNCNWSQHMEENTLSQSHIAHYLNTQFYPVKFNAGQRAAVEVADKTYKQVRKSGETYHEFTAFITMGRMSTPTVVFFDENLRLLQPIAGYKSAENFEMIMTYYSENYYKEVPWSRYQRSYVPLTARSQQAVKKD